jgi:hypothetical protein
MWHRNGDGNFEEFRGVEFPGLLLAEPWVRAASAAGVDGGRPRYRSQPPGLLPDWPAMSPYAPTGG